MRHSLQIQLRASEGAVIRALGLIERRGFRIETVQVAEAQGDGQSMDVEVSSDRSGDLLKRQLERLHDVIWVELRQPSSQWAAQGGLRSMTGSN